MNTTKVVGKLDQHRNVRLVGCATPPGHFDHFDHSTSESHFAICAIALISPLLLAATNRNGAVRGFESNERSAGSQPPVHAAA